MLWQCLGWGNDIHKPHIRKTKFKIDGLKAKTLLCHTSSPEQRRKVQRCDRCQSLCFVYFCKQIRYCNVNNKVRIWTKYWSPLPSWEMGQGRAIRRDLGWEQAHTFPFVSLESIGCFCTENARSAMSCSSFREALGENMSKNVQTKECWTIGWKMDQSKSFQGDSSTENPRKFFFLSKVGEARVFER